ncbi:SPOR domain-containing protein [Pedobacter metabolipauper]|uniref:Sporulation related protein n=1 Tax=Pedobacter metabolipauper TaxID=425513 RepID=A0A4R6SR36_9SPHI|nr:SPOR domain-containing protein [Pedobacter metabolipauper]TDQ06552.1 sporulation related protein [Pedobacter metabolipauper]
MKLAFTGIFCCLTFSLLAQTRGVVTVIKDPMIDSLIARRIQLNVAAVKPAGVSGSNAARPLPVVSQIGYRVQVFYGSNRREVFNEQARFKSLFPTFNTYITYKEPNYYLRVGDFRTRLEAQRMINELRPVFPTLFIFREKINAPNLEYSNDK